ncbi:hypothetical protein OROGR_032584 [Orobanche gracilis]
MADAKPKEREIPVFTVLKNNCILKNIYLLDNPPSISPSPSSFQLPENIDQESEIEVILVVGRHPDCNIKLEHPSISRFHLRIHSKPSFRSLYVTDLSSVHGTWISEKRIEPDVRMKLNEGDTLRLGASSRLYRLDWVPISRAYDIDNPFVPQLDAADTVDEETDEDMNLMSYRNNQVESLSDNLEGIERLFSDEDFSSSKQSTTLVAPLMPLDLYDSVTLEEIEKNSSPGLYGEENEGRFEKENSTPVAHLETTETSEMNWDKKSCLSIWSRRGKPKSVNVETIRLRQNRTRVNMSLSVEKSLLDENHKSELVPMDIDAEGESSTPEKANASPDSPTFKTPGSKSEENLKNGPILNTSFSSMDQDDEIFTPDKENMTPNSRPLMSMKNILVKSPPSSHWKSSPLKTMSNSNVHQEGTVICASEASRRKKVFRESNSINSRNPAAFRCRAENRDPFCPLPLNSPSDLKMDSKPPVSERSTIGSGRGVKYPESQENNTIQVAGNRWIIVVDTASLLNKKSRNELHLLRGLHGTTLVIPRIVVRELDCMLRRGSLFTRTTEVSAALHYIEESMAVAKWWIHVQGSAEEGKLIPPTPPASSTHWLGEDMWTSSIGSTPFSPCSLQEIATPTAGDHILEYALYYKRIKKEGQLVLLTDDVTLKIKAMAEVRKNYI